MKYIYTLFIALGLSRYDYQAYCPLSLIMVIGTGLQLQLLI